ncbi:Carboxylesterase [Fimicolochytrium jonesii]|uniref:Carboxylesterase n=1 Tax=Fimicolochytrium jonesii TaxID=1396493 RepID=UPI0022FEAB21|nr:Carboxylesterase [Fimicolochytrium jonesii]KAI8821336.1 Carboxylesterase [Fimicolochytrium jonesii]
MLSKLYILLISSAVFSVHTHAVTVLAPTGPVTGRTSTKGNFAFLGIPFAEAGRWEAPSVVTPWISPLEAFEFKQSCPQICQDVLCPDSIGEDCLFLNVWTPAADSSKIQTTSTPLSNPQTPVLVFFHGGSFDIGGAGMTAYDGAELAAALGVVVVTFNYRLSVFGFFDFAGVDPSDTAPSAVNFGILDQRAALTWVQTNIASFGGNAADVTLLGQSAGAQSILLQLLQPSVRSTIKNIILMSPPALSLRTSQRGRAQAAAVAKKLGCSSRSCLNLHSMRDILTANADASDSDYRTLSGVSLGDMTPIVDGVDITMNPYDVLGRDDLLGGLRIVIGGVSNETWLMIDKANPGNLSTPLFNVIMEAIYTPHDEVLRNVYDADSPGYLASRKPVLTQMTSDWIFLCPQRKVLQATSSTARVWAYILEAPWLGGSDEAIGNICDGNACHTTDLSYLFRTPGDCKG